MIVLHGVAGLAKNISEYTLSIDNTNYEITPGIEIFHDKVVSTDINGRAKTDGTSIGAGAKIKIKIKTSNVSDMKIKSGYCEGEKNTLSPVDDVGGLTKEEYLSEIYAFMNTGRVDFSMSGVSYDSPKDGVVFGTWMSSVPPDGLTVNVGNIELVKTGEDEFTITYDTKDIVEAQGDCDWYVASSMNLKIDIVTKSGAIAPEEEIVYYHDDAPIASYVNILEDKYLTFDSDIAIMGGWWETSEVPVRRRNAATVGTATRDSMFKYLIFGSISPSVFSPNIRNMVFTASRSDNHYIMDKVLANNTYECPDLNGMGILSSGPELSGSASIITHASLGAISIDTSGAQTAFGEMHIELSDFESANSCKFQIKSGYSPSENFIGAAANAVVVYNQITGPGTTSITGTNIDNELAGFHLFVGGLQEYLIYVSWDPSDTALALMTRGISCILGGNMIDYVFFLQYERTKSILWGTERRIVIGEITNTQEYYLSSMSAAQVGIDATTRKKIARQWLEMLDMQYMRLSGPLMTRTFFLNFMCVYISFHFPDSVPYTLGLPMYGVPMNENVSDSADIENHIMTDEVQAMMKKNAQYTMYKSRMDWAMAIGDKFADLCTFWAWGGTLVTIVRDGKHQELYSSNDPAYGLNSTGHTSPASTPGEIGDKWNEYRNAMIPVSRLANWYERPTVAGADAEQAIAEWRNDAVSVLNALSSSMIINLDDSTVAINGREAIDAIIQRPNPDVIIAFEKPE